MTGWWRDRVNSPQAHGLRYVLVRTLLTPPPPRPVISSYFLLSCIRSKYISLAGELDGESLTVIVDLAKQCSRYYIIASMFIIPLVIRKSTLINLMLYCYYE